MEQLEVRRMRHHDRRASQGLLSYPEQGKHRLRFKEQAKRELLPIDPIREFIVSRIGRPYTVGELEKRWAIGESALNRMLSDKTKFIEFDTIDRILTAESYFIWDFYPKEYEEMLESVAVSA